RLGIGIEHRLNAGYLSLPRHDLCTSGRPLVQGRIRNDKSTSQLKSAYVDRLSQGRFPVLIWSDAPKMAIVRVARDPPTVRPAAPGPIPWHSRPFSAVPRPFGFRRPARQLAGELLPVTETVSRAPELSTTVNVLVNVP